MKTSLLLCGLALATLASGCSRKAHSQAARPPQRTVLTQVFQLNTSLDTPSTPSAPGTAEASSLAVATPPATPQLRNFDEIVDLRDYSERVSLRWTEALREFHKHKHRIPASLAELRHAHPKLAKLPAPKGFQLEIDPVSVEVNVVRGGLPSGINLSQAEVPAAPVQ